MKKRDKNIIVLAGLASLTMHIINRAAYSKATSKKLLITANDNFYNWRFGKIKYTVQGTGAPVLLIHDLTVGSSSFEFYKIVSQLAKKYEVYTIDLLGYGLSDKPDMTYTNFLYVQLITDFIKNIIGKKTNIIATGDSFPIAIMTCHNDPDIINKLIAINPQSLFQLNQIPSNQTRLLKFLLNIPVIGTYVYNVQTSKASFTKKFQEEFYYNPYNAEEKEIDCYVEAAHTPNHHSKHTYASYLSRYMNANIVHALKEINNSIYLIGGEKKEDIHTTIENYEYYNTAIESVFIPVTKHLIHMERPDALLDHLFTFLEY